MSSPQTTSFSSLERFFSNHSVLYPSFILALVSIKCTWRNQVFFFNLETLLNPSKHFLILITHLDSHILNCYNLTCLLVSHLNLITQNWIISNKETLTIECMDYVT